MDSKIVIDVILGDRARSFEAKHRLQKAAYDDVMQSLKTCLSQAREFRNETAPQPSPNDELMRIHNAVFVNGPRGAGKTAFMLNLKKVWKEQATDKDANLYFFNPIDPTLLDNADSFVNVIVAHIYRIVSKHPNGGPASNFWKAFEKVAEALEAGSTISDNDVFGAQRVMATRDHAELELNLNHFFRSACEILSANALVILIDDVDMSLEWGFKVLEVVRRYLACPLVIPIISGDLKQYEVLVMSHFARELKIKTEMKNLSWRDLQTPADQIDESKAALVIMARRLAVEYLQKILPLHQRVRIKTIPELIEVGDTPVYVGCGIFEIELKEFLDQLAYALNFNTNGVEGSRPPVEVQTARELIQLLQILYRRDLIPSERANWSRMMWTSRQQRRILVDAVGEYWRSHNRAELYTRAQADMQLLGLQPPARLADITFFDPRKHDQTIARYDLNIPASHLLERLSTNLENIQRGSLPRALMPMPAFEPISDDLFVRKQDWTTHVVEGRDPQIRFLFRLYTYSGYYTSFQTANLLFFGRVFELIISHLFGRIDEENLKILFREPPYLSYFHYHPTQTTNLGVDAVDDDEDDDETVSDQSDAALLIGDFERQWLGSVREWYDKNPMLSERPPSAQLIYKVTNKFFNQINLYKAPPDSGTPVAGTLADQNLRLQFILMNAFASFESDRATLALENFALGDLRNIQQAGAWNLNIKPLLDRPDDSFTKAISTHPLFERAPSMLEEVPLTSASGRGAGRSAMGASVSVHLSAVERNRLKAQATKLDRGDKVRATTALLAVLGDLRDEIWNLDLTGGGVADVAERIIADVRDNSDELSNYARTIAAQVSATGGHPGRIRQILSRAGRLDEFLRLLLDIR